MDDTLQKDLSVGGGGGIGSRGSRQMGFQGVGQPKMLVIKEKKNWKKALFVEYKH